MKEDLFLSCLADSTRAAILRALRNGPACVGELVDGTGHTQSNVSHHLAKLRDCGLVTFERRGKNVLYSIQPAVTRVLDEVATAAQELEDCEVCT